MKKCDSFELFCVKIRVYLDHHNEWTTDKPQGEQENPNAIQINGNRKILHTHNQHEMLLI